MATAKLIAKKPAAGKTKPADFPRFTRTRLDSGFQVIVANVPGRPMAAAQLLFEAAASYEPEAEGGVASVTAQSLLVGTGKHKSSSYIQALEELGASIDAGADWDTFTLNLNAPVARLEPALELLAEAVRDPQLPWSDVDRLTQQRLGGVMQEYSDPSSRATIAFNKLVYTPDSPYARSSQGTFWSVSAMGKKSVKKYYEKFVTPGQATLILAGDLEGFPAEKVAEKYFGGWKAKEPERSQKPVAENLTKTVVTLIDRFEAEQSQIQIGHVGVPQSTPDYFPITAVIAAFGGLFDSRLNRVLREEKGYTYGIGAGMAWRRQAGPFRVSTAVDTAVTVDAVRTIVDLLTELKEGGLNKEELQSVKGYLTGSFVLGLEDPRSVAGALASMVTFGLAEDYFDTYRDNVESITLDDANKAAQTHLHPERLGIVVVGDADEVQYPLQEAEFGPVATIKDPEPGTPPND